MLIVKRLIYIVCVLLLPYTQVSGQGFTRLDWNELRIDSVLPVYSEVVPLETDYRLYDYQVKVRYPEWSPLTPSEAAVACRFDEQLSDSLQIESFVGVERGRGLMDLSFIPVIKHNGSYQKLLSAKIEIQPLLKDNRNPRNPRLIRPTRAATSAERYAAHSVLATGKWVKISVENDGIYHLTNSQIRKMGFNPQRVRVYGYGGHLQDELIHADSDWDDLEQVALIPVADGYLFHANGLVHWSQGKHVLNHYARSACYFVTEAETDTEAMAVVDWSAEAGEAAAVTTCQAFAVHDPQEYAWFQGGRRLYENYDYASSNSRSYTLTLPAYPSSNRPASFTVSFTAASDDATSVTPTVNGTVLEPLNIPGLTSYSSAMESSKTYASLDAPQLKTTVQLSSSSGHSARLNFFEISYEGELKIDATIPSLQFSHSASDAVFLVNYASGQQPRLLQLAEPGSPAVDITGSATTVDGQSYYRFPVAADGTEHGYIVFDAAAYSSYPQPTIVGEIGSQDLHAVDSLDMVILTPASGLFDAQAERLAAIHREVDGMKVGVFRADQVYNEFSSGTPDATAYRRFMKMLYDRGLSGGVAPRYLLLFGDGAWDNRMLTTTWRTSSPDDFLLCFESDSSLNDVVSFVMEDYFGLLDDGEGASVEREKVDIGVGRFPVRTIAEAQALVDKTISYIRSEYSGSWKNVVCFLGDDGDNNDHLIKADDVAESVIKKHPEIEVRKIMWDAYPRVGTASGFRFPQAKQVIDRQMEEGALMMNYTGHAATYSLSHEQVMRIEDFAGYTSPRVPLWVTAACDVMPFDSQKENIGETAILNQSAAAVAFYGTTRTVYASKNLTLNKAFCDAVFDSDEDGRPNRLGDAVRYSKVYVATTESYYRENKLHYVLLGDPALRLGSIQNRVVLDRINGTAVSELPDDFTIHAGAKVTLGGHLVDAEGHELSDFEGTIYARLYDSKSSIVCLNADDADEAFTYSTYDKILYDGTDSIHAGRFELVCPIPIDIKYSDEAGRLLFYALSADRRIEANGYNEDFLVGGTEPDLNDHEGPKIAAWIGNEEFQNGDAVCATPYFFARLEDESGINTAGNSLGHDLELIVDGDPSLSFNLNNNYSGDFGDYRRGTVAFSLPSLSTGAHSLLFRAWDTQNNENHVQLDFIVDPKLPMHLLDLTASVNPAKTQTSFLLTYDRPGSDCQFTLEVFDFAGRLLWTHTETGSNANGFYAVPWNLTTGGGFPLGSGIYLYRARVSCGDSEEVTKTQKLIINRRQ